MYDALGARMAQMLTMDRLPVSSSGSRDGSESGSTGDSSSSSGSGSGTDSLFVTENDVVLPHHLSLMAWSFAKQVGSPMVPHNLT
jgi:hypothetical protein